MLRTNLAAVRPPLLMDCVVPGGVARDLAPDARARRSRDECATLEREIARAARHLRRARRPAGPLPRLRHRDAGARARSSASPAWPGAPAARRATCAAISRSRPTTRWRCARPARTRRRRRRARRRALRRDRWNRCGSCARSSTRCPKATSRAPLPDAAGVPHGPRLRRRLARAGAGRARMRPRRHDPPLPSARSVVAELAGARARGDRQHRSRLSADQQVVQPVVQRTRPLGTTPMLHILRQIAKTGIKTEARARARRRRWSSSRGCRQTILQTLGPRADDPPGRRRLVQRLRARDPRARQPVLQPRGPRHPVRREPAPRRHAAGDGPGVEAHGDRAAAHLRRDARARSSSSPSATAAAPAASSARATRASAAWPT